MYVYVGERGGKRGHGAKWGYGEILMRVEKIKFLIN